MRSLSFLLLPRAHAPRRVHRTPRSASPRNSLVVLFVSPCLSSSRCLAFASTRVVARLRCRFSTTFVVVSLVVSSKLILESRVFAEARFVRPKRNPDDETLLRIGFRDAARARNALIYDRREAGTAERDLFIARGASSNRADDKIDSRG